MESSGKQVWLAGSMVMVMLLATACKREPTARWDVDVTGPLLKTTFTIRDLVPDSLLITDEEGAITLLYRDELFALSLDTVLQTPDTNFVYFYALPFPGPVQFPAGVTPFAQEDVTNFDLGDVALRTLIIREGYLDLELRNKVNSTLLGSFSLPGATQGGTTPTINVTVGPGTPSQPAVAHASRNLAFAHFDLRGPQLDQVNTLGTQLSMQLDPAGTGASVTDQDSIIVTATYRDLVPQYARGYFGNRVVEIGPETIGLDLFSRVIDGFLDLDQVTLRLVVENGLGADFQIFLRQFKAENTRTGTMVDLAHSILQGPINLNRAIETGGGYQPGIHQNEMDNSDSNVDLFIESLPDRITYELDLHMNPLGDISNGNDFLFHNSRIRAELELEIPLNFIATDLTLQSTLEATLPGTAQAHALRSGGLKLFATNGFPFSAGLEIEIVNIHGELLSHVPVQGVVASGILGVNGLVQQEVASQLEASLNEEQVDLLYAGGRFRIRTRFHTADQTQHIRILDSYKLDLQITTAARYMVNGDE